eukprot:22015_1
MTRLVPWSQDMMWYDRVVCLGVVPGNPRPKVQAASVIIVVITRMGHTIIAGVVRGISIWKYRLHHVMKGRHAGDIRVWIAEMLGWVGIRRGSGVFVQQSKDSPVFFRHIWTLRNDA